MCCHAGQDSGWTSLLTWGFISPRISRTRRVTELHLDHAALLAARGAHGGGGAVAGGLGFSLTESLDARDAPRLLQAVRVLAAAPPPPPPGSRRTNVHGSDAVQSGAPPGGWAAEVVAMRIGQALVDAALARSGSKRLEDGSARLFKPLLSGLCAPHSTSLASAAHHGLASWAERPVLHHPAGTRRLWQLTRRCCSPMWVQPSRRRCVR